MDIIQSGPGRFGFAATAAAILDNWDQWILNPDRSAPGQFVLATQAERYLLPTMGGQDVPAVLDAGDTDLRKFRARGGKLLMYLGWSDALISPDAGRAYYESLSRRMGGVRLTQTFARMFVAPGMQHCQGGITPNSFGQAWVAPGISTDPRHEIRSALQAWVEAGRAPQSLIAANFAPDNRTVTATQQLRPYPQAAGPVVGKR